MKIWLYRRSQIYKFPFDPELGITESRTIPNGDNTPVEDIVIVEPEGSVEECIDDWKGDGNCDLTNNSDSWDYDGGDWCRNTCISNCLLVECSFGCGSGSYECINVDAGWELCVHGTCTDPTQWLSTDAQVDLAVEVCNLSACSNTDTWSLEVCWDEIKAADDNGTPLTNDNIRECLSVRFIFYHTFLFRKVEDNAESEMMDGQGMDETIQVL